MEDKILDWQGKKIYYRVTGKGKPVLLLHGFGEDGNVWENQVQVLKENFRLIIPDIPGSGRSELVDNANIDTYAEIVRAILDTEENAQDEICLVGHSMGGYITLAFAEKYPQYLNSFGLFHSTASPDTDEKKQTRKKAIEFIKEKGAYAFLKTSTPGLFTEEFKRSNAGKVEALIEAGKNFTDAALVQYYEAMIARPDRTHVLKDCDKPVLFIMGEHDNAVPMQSSLKQCYLPLVSHVHILNSSAHMGMWEETDKSNTILEEFISFY
ncbi:MAG: alpha/beta hydrolase [Ferruginibacter sp.]